MGENQELLSELQQLLKQKRSKSFYAEKLNITIDLVEELLKQIKGDIVKQEEFNETQKKVNNEKGTLESTIETSFEPKDDIELAKLHKINLDKYKINSYWSKLRPNGKFSSSVLATLKKPADYTPEDFTKFLSNWEPTKFFKKVINYHDSNEKEWVDIELNIADFHLAKKTFQGDTLQSKEFDYYRTITDLVEKVKSSHNIDKIVFPIGNDMFHTDTYQNTTSNGTPQDVTAWYDEEYEKGFDILANSINYLITQSKSVEVILVAGNHERTKAFYVAHALEVFFKEYKNIKFQREHSVTKSTVLGNTFIGYHHGNSCKLEELPLLFATGDKSKEFGNAKYREIHTGDKHFYMAKEVKGVRIQQMPSLSGTDRWHQDNGYVHQLRAALVLIYHPVQGRIGEFEFRL